MKPSDCLLLPTCGFQKLVQIGLRHPGSCQVGLGQHAAVFGAVHAFAISGPHAFKERGSFSFVRRAMRLKTLEVTEEERLVNWVLPDQAEVQLVRDAKRLRIPIEGSTPKVGIQQQPAHRKGPPSAPHASNSRNRLLDQVQRVAATQSIDGKGDRQVAFKGQLVEPATVPSFALSFAGEEDQTLLFDPWSPLGHGVTPPAAWRQKLLRDTWRTGWRPCARAEFLSARRPAFFPAGLFP